MMRALLIGFGVTSLVGLGFAFAQPVDTAEDAPGMGPGPLGHRPPPPLIGALDADADRVISADEIANATDALLSLDTNGDGELTIEELRPERVGRLKLIDRLDTDENGVVSLDEFLAKAEMHFNRIDSDGNGEIDADEAAEAGPRHQHGRRGFGRRGFGQRN